MDIKDIKDLIITIDKTSIEKVEIKKDDIKIMISKGAADKGIVNKDSAPELLSDNMENSVPAMSADGGIREFRDKIDKTEYGEGPTVDENTFIVKSPMIGTFYRASSPDSLPFADIGDVVQKGQILCIIEAMKIMNEIECETAGEIIEIFVDDEDTVEYGQPLMLIRR